MKFKTYKEIGEECAEYALDEFLYREKTIRQWIDEIATLETKWDKLYRWLNDFCFAIAPDETVTDYEERQDRTAQYDVLQEVMDMMTELDEKERTNDTD